MKYFMFFLLMYSVESIAGAVTSTIWKVGMSKYENYAFIKTELPINNPPECAENNTTLVWDIRTDSGKILYSTALSAHIAQKKLFIMYDDNNCPEGTTHNGIVRFHIDQK